MRKLIWVLNTYKSLGRLYNIRAGEDKTAFGKIFSKTKRGVHKTFLNVLFIFMFQVNFLLHHTFFFKVFCSFSGISFAEEQSVNFIQCEPGIQGGQV